VSNGKGKMSAEFITCLLLLAAPVSMSAESAKSKSKESSPKQSSVASMKVDTTAVAEEKSPADPVICVTPGDAAVAQAAVDEKSSAKPASDAQAEPESQSDTGYVKDKLRLSLGKKSAPDQPQQCGVDEAESQK
jgi:hypothetical protein